MVYWAPWPLILGTMAPYTGNCLGFQLMVLHQRPLLIGPCEGSEDEGGVGIYYKERPGDVEELLLFCFSSCR